MMINENMTGEMIETSDPVLAMRSICRRNCNIMHTLADLMQRVSAIKYNYYNYHEFGSARTPEECDKILNSLIYIMSCEANCGVAEAGIIAGKGSIKVPEYKWG